LLPPLYTFFFQRPAPASHLPSLPTRRSSDLVGPDRTAAWFAGRAIELGLTFLEPIPQRIHALRGKPNYPGAPGHARMVGPPDARSEEHTSELQSLTNLVCRLLLEKKKRQQYN